MKKIFLLIFSLFIVLLHFDTKAGMAKEIDLMNEDGEVSLVFIKFHKNISLLIDSEDESVLYLIKGEGDGLDKILNIFKVNPKIINIPSDYQIEINNYNLCILENKEEAKACDFIYLLDLKEDFMIDDNVSVVFYDENVNNDYLKTVNESWVDSHIVSKESVTILKLNNEGYNIFVIPLANN